MWCDRELRDGSVSSRLPVRVIRRRLVLPYVRQPGSNGRRSVDMSRLWRSSADDRNWHRTAVHQELRAEQHRSRSISKFAVSLLNFYTGGIGQRMQLLLNRLCSSNFADI